MAKLVVALDYSDPKDALDMANILKGHVEWVKVGLELFITAGPSIIEQLKAMNYKVFVDLKLHDIPNTVQKAALAVAKHKADLMTIHVCGGEAMVKATVEAIKENSYNSLVFGITVLTSMSEGEIIATDKSINELTNLYATKAAQWGLHGIVCSGQEVKEIKRNNPSLLALCPGIRLASGELNDQKRVMTPYDAAKNGADFLVVGRPITKAQNPLEAVKEVLADIAKVQE